LGPRDTGAGAIGPAPSSCGTGTVPMSRAASLLGGEIAVKKLFVVLALGAAGFAVWKKIEADKAEQALWAEVTDPVT
jgi:hypothetical protein